MEFPGSRRWRNLPCPERAGGLRQIAVRPESFGKMSQQIPLDGTGCVIDQNRVYRFALLGFSAFRFYLNSENNSRKMLPLKSEPPEPLRLRGLMVSFCRKRGDLRTELHRELLPRIQHPRAMSWSAQPPNGKAACTQRSPDIHFCTGQSRDHEEARVFAHGGGRIL